MDDSKVPRSKVRAKVPVELNRASRSFMRYRDSQIVRMILFSIESYISWDLVRCNKG